jgi:hypothetical protein
VSMRKEIYSRFEAKVALIPFSECHWWTGALAGGGYGSIRDGVMRPAHRVAYELYKGPIPEGLVVMHSCDNPACVNPRHLSVGTQQDNVDDMFRKGRECVDREWTAGERNGRAKLTTQQVLEMRARVAGGEKQRDMMAEYGLSEGLVSMIIRRKRWSHI